MTPRKHSDARRFSFCTRCLLAASPDRSLTEHHLDGRRQDRTAIVFVCEKCHSLVENAQGPVPLESDVLRTKRNLLINSSALRWVVKNAKGFADGIARRNRNGVSCALGPAGGTWQPPYAAVGHSGRNYYFIPPVHCDEFVEPAASPAPVNDGVGDCAGGASWMRFRGTNSNIHNEFLDEHHRQGSPGIDLEVLRQDPPRSGAA